MTEMEELQAEITMRVAGMSEEDRLKVSRLLLAIAKCFGPKAQAEAVLVLADSDRMLTVMGTSDRAKSLHMFCAAHELLHEEAGAFTERTVH